MADTTSVRLNKYLAECGVCSRREADVLIEAGKVTVNGKKAEPGMKVSSADEVICNGKPLKSRNEKVVLAYYKPLGVTCTEKDRFADKTLKDFTREVAAKEGKPGGGSVAGLTGASAAALGIMVANLTVGKKKYAEHEKEVIDARDKLETLRNYLLYLVDEDIKAFAPLAKYSAMDKSDPEVAKRYQESLRTACFIPNEIHYKMVEVAEFLSVIAEYGCVGAISDVGSALCMARSVMETCRYTTLANAKYIKDEVYAETLRREFDISFSEIMPKIDAALATVEKKLSR